MNPYSSFLKPSELSLIVGRQNYERRFESILSQFQADKFKQNLVIISGPPGIGKSSLLDLYSEIIKREKLTYLQPTVKMGKMNLSFFRELYQVLSPYLEPEKKSFFQKSKELQVKSVTSHLDSSEIVNTFINNLKVRPLKIPVIILLDPIDRIVDTNPFILDILRDLISSLRGKFPLFFIIVVQNYNTSLMREIIQMGEHIVVEALSLADSKLLLSKLLRDPFKITEQLQEDFIKQSELFPFHILFISEVLAWVTEKIRNEGFSGKESTISELAQPFIKKFALRAFIQEIFSISEEEDDTIQLMLNSPVNAVHKDVFSKEMTRNSLETLQKKGLVIKQGDYYQFSSYSLYYFLGLGTRVVEKSTEIELLLNIIENDIKMTVDINTKVLVRLEQIVLSTVDLGDFSLPNRAKVLFTSVLNQRKYYTAFRLALLTGNLFRIAKDVYRGGQFLEECAQSFYTYNKVNYAKYMYQKALEAYQHADKRKRLRNTAQKAASIYLDEALQYINQNQLELARASFYHSIQLFKQADDFQSASEAVDKAILTYKNPDHKKFFKKLLPSFEPYIELKNS